jgi:hypothetical protein
MNRRILIVLISLICELGCNRPIPPSITMLNNSGKVLSGNVSVGKEEAPFHDRYSHGGWEPINGGEEVSVTVTDLWSTEIFTLKGIVPPAPSGDSYRSLMLEIQKDQVLAVSWKTDSITLMEHHFNYMQANFDVIPIVVHYEAKQLDFHTYMRQDSYSQGLRKSSEGVVDKVLSYGFLHQGTASPGTVMVSRERNDELQTRFFQISQDLKTNFPNTTAVYVHLTEDSDEAEVYLLSDTTDDPWQLTQDLLAEKIQLPMISFKVPISDTLREIRTGNMRLPDPEEIE